MFVGPFKSSVFCPLFSQWCIYIFQEQTPHIYKHKNVTETFLWLCNIAEKQITCFVLTTVRISGILLKTSLLIENIFTLRRRSLEVLKCQLISGCKAHSFSTLSHHQSFVTFIIPKQNLYYYHLRSPHVDVEMCSI